MVTMRNTGNYEVTPLVRSHFEDLRSFRVHSHVSVVSHVFVENPGLSRHGVQLGHCPTSEKDQFVTHEGHISDVAVRDLGGGVQRRI